MRGYESPAPMTQGGIPTNPPQQTTPPQPSHAAQGGGNPLGPVGKASEAVQRPTTTGMRKPMRGPDMGAMFGGAPPPTFEPNELPMMSPSRKRPLDVETGAPPKRGRDQSDRLSDIVSDDSSDVSSDAGSSDRRQAHRRDLIATEHSYRYAPGGWSRIARWRSWIAWRSRSRTRLEKCDFALGGESRTYRLKNKMLSRTRV